MGYHIHQAVKSNVLDDETNGHGVSANVTHIIYAVLLPEMLQLYLTTKKQMSPLKAILQHCENVKVTEEQVGNCPEGAKGL